MIEEVPKGAALLRGGNMSVCEGGRERAKGEHKVGAEREGKEKLTSSQKKLLINGRHSNT